MLNQMLKWMPEYGVWVSSTGEVYSPSKNGLKQPKKSISCKGYVQLCAGGQCRLLHRLVAEAFIPNPLGLPTVDHINRDKTDNRLENLRWATYSEQRMNQDPNNHTDYYQTHREQHKKYQQTYYARNRDKIIRNTHERYLKTRGVCYPTITQYPGKCLELPGTC